MTQVIILCGRPVGAGHPTFVIAEAGINHNGDLNIARRLVNAAKEAHLEAGAGREDVYGFIGSIPGRSRLGDGSSSKVTIAADTVINRGQLA